MVFAKNIIEQMAEEKGIPKNEMKEIIKLNIDYLKKTCSDPEVVSIKIGKEIGNLIASKDILGYSYRNSRGWKEGKFKDYIDNIIKPKYDMLMSAPYYRGRDKRKKHYKVPFLLMLRNRGELLRGKKFGNVVMYPHNVWIALSEWQNKLNSK